MKLSDLKGERAVEVIADIIAPLSSIASDQEQLQLFRIKRQEGESDKDVAVRDISVKIPKLLKTHKADVLAILCAINGTEPEELSVMEIIKQAMELIGDPDFLSLFISAVNSTDQKPPTESSVEQDRTMQE